MLEVRDGAGELIATSDDWRSSQQAEITANGLAPVNDREAAIILNLPGSSERNSYTAVLTGDDGGQGIGLVEVYDLDAESFADLGNVSTRSLVGAGDEVLIGGYIVRDNSFSNRSQTILMRGIGPSLSGAGIANPLQDPQITLVDPQGNALVSNDDWQQSPEAAAMSATGIAPSHPKEAADSAVSPTGSLHGNLAGSGWRHRHWLGRGVQPRQPVTPLTTKTWPRRAGVYHLRGGGLFRAYRQVAAVPGPPENGCWPHREKVLTSERPKTALHHGISHPTGV